MTGCVIFSKAAAVKRGARGLRGVMAGVALKAFPFLDPAQTEAYMATPLVAERRVKPISHVCAALQLRCPLFIPDKTKAGGCRLFKTGTQFGGGNFAGFVLIGMNGKSQTLNCILLESGRWGGRVNKE